MSENDTTNKFSAEKLRKLAGIIDFILYLVKLINEHLTKLHRSLASLPEEYSTWDAVEIMSEVANSMVASVKLIIKIMPSSKSCGEERSQDFWDLHTALILYYHEALMLLKHSLLSAITGYYSVAFIELRSAMESVVRGVVFDLLTIPEYRVNANELLKIKGFGGAKSYPELIRFLRERLGDKRSEVSAEIFDLIDEELGEFNPEAAFTKLLLQLKDWGIIDDELFKEMESYYIELSKPVHRTHLRFSEVGIRVLAEKDWLDLEPVPDILFAYFHNFAELNELFTYLVLKVFNIDLVREDFRRCINWSELSQDIHVTSELAETYESWKKAVEVLEQLKTS